MYLFDKELKKALAESAAEASRRAEEEEATAKKEEEAFQLAIRRSIRLAEIEAEEKKLAEEKRLAEEKKLAEEKRLAEEKERQKKLAEERERLRALQPPEILSPQEQAQLDFVLKMSAQEVQKKLLALSGDGIDQAIVECPSTKAALVIGKSFARVNSIASQHEVKITVPPKEHSQTQTFFVVEGSPLRVAKAVEFLERIINDGPVKKPASIAAPVPLVGALADSKIFVFVDNSNIFIGAQQTAEGPDHTIRMNVENLVEVVEQGRATGARIVVGSTPPATNAIWQRWKGLGYQVRLGLRETKEGKQREVFVDDALHATMAKFILDPAIKGKSNTFVLLSGDGNDNEGFCTFPTLLKGCIDKGILVEVWAWKNSFSKNYFKLQQQHPEFVTLRYLDDFRDKIAWSAKRPEPSMVPQPYNNVADDLMGLCVACWGQPSTVTFHPCGHKLLCQNCLRARRIQDCSLCHKPIRNVQF